MNSNKYIDMLLEIYHPFNRLVCNTILKKSPKNLLNMILSFSATNNVFLNLSLIQEKIHKIIH